MTDRQDLIARLEQASEGSRELSDEVLKACGWYHCVDRRLPDRSQYGWLVPGKDIFTLVTDDPSPTESLSAAWSLAPEGWRSLVCGYRNGRAFIILHQPGKKQRFEGCAATPALALAAAALKARESG